MIWSLPSTDVQSIVRFKIFRPAILGRDRDFVIISFPANRERSTKIRVLFHHRTRLSSCPDYLDRLLTGFQAPTF